MEQHLVGLQLPCLHGANVFWQVLVKKIILILGGKYIKKYEGRQYDEDEQPQRTVYSNYTADGFSGTVH